MKHVFIIETAATVGPRGVDNLLRDVEAAADKNFGDGAVAVLHYCNAESAIRAAYRLYGADESRSPDELGSAHR